LQLREHFRAAVRLLQFAIKGILVLPFEFLGALWHWLGPRNADIPFVLGASVLCLLGHIGSPPPQKRNVLRPDCHIHCCIGRMSHAAVALVSDASCPVPALLLANVLPSELLQQVQVMLC
jgi:hypothetical protein